MQVVAGPVDEVETSVGDPGNEFLLSLGRVHEVIAPGDDQGRRTDLAQPVDHGPALVQVRPAKISASGASFERPLPEHHASGGDQAHVRVVEGTETHQDPQHVLRREVAVEPAPDEFRLLGPVAALGNELRRVLSEPAAVGARVEQDEVREAVGVAEGVLEGDVAAERVAEYRPGSKPRLARSASASAVRFSKVIDSTGAPVERPLQAVVEDHGELDPTNAGMGASSSGHRQDPVHQQQRVAAPMTSTKRIRLGSAWLSLRSPSQS